MFYASFADEQLTFKSRIIYYTIVSTFQLTATSLFCSPKYSTSNLFLDTPTPPMFSPFGGTQSQFYL
jgi:hypothetical protein